MDLVSQKPVEPDPTASDHPTKSKSPRSRARIVNKWKKAVNHVNAASATRQVRLMNPAYEKMTPKQDTVRSTLYALITSLVMAIYVAFAIFILAAFTQLNIWIIYVWGKCADADVRAAAKAQGLVCRDPEFAH